MSKTKLISILIEETPGKQELTLMGKRNFETSMACIELFLDDLIANGDYDFEGIIETLRMSYYARLLGL